MEHGKLLNTEEDFEDAIENGVEVSVTQDGKHLGSGRIISQTNESVRMVNAYYFKNSCEFTVCTLVH
jgi:hypothetical protein